MLEEFLQSLDLAFGVLGAAAVALLCWRLLWPSWRILQRTVYHDTSFRYLRALTSTMHLGYHLLEARSLYKAARLRVEVELILPRPTPDDFTSRVNHRRRLKEWRHRRDRVLAELVHQAREGPPTIEVATCFDLYKAEDRIRRYFEALETERSTSVSDRDRFLCRVKVKTGFIAPLHLIAGLLAHFGNNWEPVINEYGTAVRLVNDPLGRRLRKLQTFLFDCWLLWGPSIPLCRCDNWRGTVAMQYGYGDENNSLPVYGETLLEEFDQELLQRIARRSNQARPIAFQVSVTGWLRWGPTMKDWNFCIAQRTVQDEKTGGLVIESENIEDIGPAARRTYYSAYLWAMFVACDERGDPVFQGEDCWRGLFPFFMHGNIAEHDTYFFLKRQLAHEALIKIDRFVHEVLESTSRLSFRYVCAIDDSGCGEDLLFPDPSPRLHGIMQELLMQPAFSSLYESGRISLELDPALEDYASCHLPEIIDAYYRTIEAAEVTNAHSA